MRLLKNAIVPLLLFFLSLLITPRTIFSWGFWAHKEINKAAIESLPDDLRLFFRAYADSLIEKSVDADKRRFGDPQEQFTHYVNIDRYGEYPFLALPHSYTEATKKFGKARVDSTGTVPWRIAEFTEKLTDAFRKKDVAAIVFYASNLGHYVADAHVPLHATENYDGQLSGQKGLHARWESRIPEKFGASYRLAHREAVYLKDPLEEAFQAVMESYEAVDSVLAADRRAQDSLPENERFTVRRSGNRTQYEYTDEYYDRFNKLLGGMVERRMNDAVHRVASFWHTAWVNAGKPEMK